MRLQEGKAGLHTAVSPQREQVGEAVGLDIHAGEFFYHRGAQVALSQATGITELPEWGWGGFSPS